MELGLSQFRVHGMAWFIVLPPSVACGASLWIWVAGPLESGAPGKPLIFLTFPSSEGLPTDTPKWVTDVSRFALALGRSPKTRHSVSTPVY